MAEFACPVCDAQLFTCERCGGIFSVADGYANDKGEAVFCVQCQRVVRELSD